MRITVLIAALLLHALAIAPAWAENCGNPCDEGWVWTDREGGKCIKPPPATS